MIFVKSVLADGVSLSMLTWIDILNKVDIVGLIEMGAPDDEYSREAAILEKLALNCESEEELTNLLYKTSKESWHTLAPDEVSDYQKAAHKIWPLLQACK